LGVVDEWSSVAVCANWNFVGLKRGETYGRRGDLWRDDGRYRPGEDSRHDWRCSSYRVEVSERIGSIEWIVDSGADDDDGSSLVLLMLEMDGWVD